MNNEKKEILNLKVVKIIYSSKVLFCASELLCDKMLFLTERIVEICLVDVSSFSGG